MLVAASMIGAGVYTTSGYTLASLGTPARVMAAWGIGGVVAICGAVCYGALARRFTESGGEYLFLARAVHPAAGMMAGWVSLLAGFTGAIAFAATTFESYAREFDGVWQASLPNNSIAISVVVVAAVIHSLGLRQGTRVQNVVVVAKFCLIAAFLALGFATVSSWEGVGATTVDPGGSNSVEPSPLTGWQFTLAFANALTWISLSFSGFNAAVYLSSEVRDPERDVPRSMFWATIGVTLLYLMLNAVFVLAPSPGEIAGEQNVATIAAGAVGRHLGNQSEQIRGLVRLAILCGLATSVSALVQTGPRVFCKMSEDGFLPRWIGGKRTEGEAPSRAIWIQAVIATVVISFANLRQQLEYLGFTLSVCAALCASLVFYLRRDAKDPVRVRWYPIVPLIYVGGTITIAILTAIRSPVQAAVGLGTLLIGIVVYFCSGTKPIADAPPPVNGQG